MDIKNFEPLLLHISAILFICLVIIFLWYFLWKVVLEPNPLIRDFFDLDSKRYDDKRV